MATIYEINNFLKDILDPLNKIQDNAINGIQIENEIENISKIGFAVDASLETFQHCINNKAEILITHHGIFWGRQIPIISNHRKRIKLALENNIGLISYHLPLDLHITYGNNAQILKKLEINDLIQFGNYKGLNIGYYGETEKEINIDQILNKLNLTNNFNYLNFGKDKIKKIGVVSGGGTFAIEEAINNKLDLFITGDSSHELYHTAKENNINILFAGHYFTETFGIKAIQQLIEKQFNIETIFFDLPTKL